MCSQLHSENRISVCNYSTSGNRRPGKMFLRYFQDFKRTLRGVEFLTWAWQVILQGAMFPLHYFLARLGYRIPLCHKRYVTAGDPWENM